MPISRVRLASVNEIREWIPAAASISVVAAIIPISVNNWPTASWSLSISLSIVIIEPTRIWGSVAAATDLSLANEYVRECTTSCQSLLLGPAGR